MQHSGVANLQQDPCFNSFNSPLFPLARSYAPCGFCRSSGSRLPGESYSQINSFWALPGPSLRMDFAERFGGSYRPSNQAFRKTTLSLGKPPPPPPPMQVGKGYFTLVSCRFPYGKLKVSIEITRQPDRWPVAILPRYHGQKGLAKADQSGLPKGPGQPDSRGFGARLCEGKRISSLDPPIRLWKAPSGSPIGGRTLKCQACGAHGICSPRLRTCRATLRLKGFWDHFRTKSDHSRPDLGPLMPQTDHTPP